MRGCTDGARKEEEAEEVVVEPKERVDIKYAWTDASSHSSLPFLLVRFSLSLSPSPSFIISPSLFRPVPSVFKPRVVVFGPAGSLSFFSRRAISLQRVACSVRVHVLSSAGQASARYSATPALRPKGGNLMSRGQPVTQIPPPFF